MKEYKILVTETRVVDVKAEDLDTAIELVDKSVEEHFDKHPECFEPIVSLEHDIVVPPIDCWQTQELTDDYMHGMRELKPWPALEQAFTFFQNCYNSGDLELDLFNDKASSS